MKTISNIFFDRNYVFNDKKQSYQFSLSNLNNQLDELNKKYGVNFVATREWFDLEMQSVIVD